MTQAGWTKAGWILAPIAAVLSFGVGHYTASHPGASSAGGSTAPSSEAPLSADSAVEAIKAALRETDPFARATRLSSVLSTLGREAVPAVQRVMKDQSVDLGSAETLLLVQAWANHEPAGAVGWATLEAFKTYRTAALPIAVEQLAAKDPEAALPFGAATEPAVLRALVRGWFRSNHQGLVEWMRDLGQGLEQQIALGAYARELIQREGTQAAAAWAGALPDDDERFKLAAFRRVARELAVADPAAAVAWCEKHCDGPYGGNLRALIAEGWVWRDGPAAMKWLSTAPEGKERDDAVADAFVAWQQDDPGAPSRWIEAIGRDRIEPWQSPAVWMHSRIDSWQDPADAIEWALLIRDDERRRATLIDIAKRWRDKDSAAAEVWLARSPLSEEERARVREPRPPQPRRGARAPS